MRKYVKLETKFESKGIMCEASIEVSIKNIIDTLLEHGLEIPDDEKIYTLLIDAFACGFEKGGNLGRINANFTNEFFPDGTTTEDVESDESEDDI